MSPVQNTQPEDDAENVLEEGGGKKERGIMVRSALPRRAAGSACGGCVRWFLREEGVFV